MNGNFWIHRANKRITDRYLESRRQVHQAKTPSNVRSHDEALKCFIDRLWEVGPFILSGFLYEPSPHSIHCTDIHGPARTKSIPETIAEARQRWKEALDEEN